MEEPQQWQDVQDALSVLERFVVLMYDRASQCQNVNDARKVLFAQKGRTLENIPPYFRCIITTCEESGLPSWTLLGTVFGLYSRIALS